MGTFNVSLKTLTERVSLEVVYTPKELDQINVEIAEVNRPGLFLAGYYDYFDKLRLQIMGLAEMNFLSGLSAEKRYEALEQLFRQQPPAVIVGRSEELEPFPEMLELAKKHSVALLRSNETTCTLMGSLISVLNLELAPRITRHGVLVEVYGEGILILGDSGIGKSELAIELVKRGHRLVADDAVELRKVSNRQIMGTAPENIRHFIELRGIGIVNVARVFGVGAVKLSESLDLVVQLEAAIDYPEEDIEEVTYDRAAEVLAEGQAAVARLVRQGSAGRILREGLRTAIVGRPNVGKSSLLNSLLQADRAIVSNIPGTTRDIIEEQMTIGGIPLVLTDTAGLRDTEDLVEKIGVERSRAALEDAQLALVVLDGSQPLSGEDRELLRSLKDRKKLILVNKSDLPQMLDTEGLQREYGSSDVIVLSVKTGEGMEQVEQWLREFVYGEGSDSESSSMTQNARQQDLLEKALRSLEDALEGARQHLPYDCLTIDLTQTLHDLGEITGEDVPDEIIDEIFAQFCVGK